MSDEGRIDRLTIEEVSGVSDPSNKTQFGFTGFLSLPVRKSAPPAPTEYLVWKGVEFVGLLPLKAEAAPAPTRKAEPAPTAKAEPAMSEPADVRKEQIRQREIRRAEWVAECEKKLTVVDRYPDYAEPDGAWYIVNEQGHSVDEPYPSKADAEDRVLERIEHFEAEARKAAMS